MTSRIGGGSTVEKMVEIPVDPEEGKALLSPQSSSDQNDQENANSTIQTSSDSTKTTKRKIKRVRRKTVDHSPLIKYGSLVLLVAQLVGLVMLMRYSRTHSNGKDLYLSSTAVFLMEVRKESN